MRITQLSLSIDTTKRGSVHSLTAVTDIQSSVRHLPKATLVSRDHPSVHQSACQNAPTTTYLALSSRRRGRLPGLSPSTVSPGGYSEDSALRRHAIGSCVWPSASSTRCRPKAVVSICLGNKLRENPDRGRRTWGRAARCEGSLRSIVRALQKA